MCEQKFWRSLIQGVNLIPIWVANIFRGLEQVQDASWQVHSPLDLMWEAPARWRGVTFPDGSDLGSGPSGADGKYLT